MTPTDQSDESLLRAFAGGSDGALEELARRYEPLLLGLAYGILGRNQSLACDAVQDTWVRVILHASSFREESTVKTWLYRVVINCCKDLLADARRRGSSSPCRHDGSAAATNEFAETQTRIQVHAAVSSLPANTQLLLLLCYQQGMTHTTAAQVLRIPVGTLKSRLNAALTELRRVLDSEVRE